MAKANDRLRQFDAQLKATVASRLEEQGFTRSGRVRLWTRPSETAKGVCQLVWFQVGESASTQGGRFTVEFGIYYPKYDRFMNGRDLAGPIIGACHFDVRTRLGLLIEPAEDRWWKYNGTEEQLAKQMAETARLVAELGLSWLAATDTAANLATYNTGKMTEPDRLRREAFLKHQAKQQNK